MTVGDSNLLSREDVIELQKLTEQLRGKSDTADPTMSIRVGVLDLVMLLKELVHLRRQVEELQARGTTHMLAYQSNIRAWDYDHQMMLEPSPHLNVPRIASELLAVALEEGSPEPDAIGYGLRIWRWNGSGPWAGNIIWKAK